MLTRHVLALVIAATSLGIFAADIPDAHAQRYYRARPHHRHYHGPYYRPHARVVAFYPSGLYVGGGLIATRVLHQDGGSELLDHGGGLTLYTGLRLNRTLALEAGWIGTLHNPEAVSTAFGDDTDYLVLNGFTGDAKIYFASSTPALEPYVQAGVGVYLLDRTYFGTESVGTGFQAGGGFDFAVGDHLSLGVRALYRGIAMGPPNEGYADTFVSAATIEGNLAFRF